MNHLRKRVSLTPVIEAIYDTSVAPEAWPATLSLIASVFHAGFADVFARTDDREHYHGVAHGLDRSDYEDVFLGQWFKRNLWGIRHPVRIAGEIVSTRQMVSKDELVRSEIFQHYLKPRGLHEGLRLAIWSGNGWIQDFSLLRPFSLGPFEAAEMEVGRELLPHLQRAAAIARRLGAAEASLGAGLAAFQALEKPAFLLDQLARVLHCNPQGEAMLEQADRLGCIAGVLQAADHPATSILHAGIARAASEGGTPQTLSMPHSGGRAPLQMTLVPLKTRSVWTALLPPSVLAVVTLQPGFSQPSAEALIGRFHLTAAEADLALDMLAGRSLAEAATRRGRSINTVRSQLRALMDKVQVRRQANLVRALMGTGYSGSVEAEF